MPLPQQALPQLLRCSLAVQPMWSMCALGRLTVRLGTERRRQLWIIAPSVSLVPRSTRHLHGVSSWRSAKAAALASFLPNLQSRAGRTLAPGVPRLGHIAQPALLQAFGGSGPSALHRARRGKFVFPGTSRGAVFAPPCPFRPSPGRGPPGTGRQAPGTGAKRRATCPAPQ